MNQEPCDESKVESRFESGVSPDLKHLANVKRELGATLTLAQSCAASFDFENRY